MTTYEKLRTMGNNLWWSWQPEALDLYYRLSPGAFGPTRNSPLAALRYADRKVLHNPEFEIDVDRVYTQFTEYISSRGDHADAPRTAYFCMEYGLHESLPLYSGGLGILAGDHVKAASDVGLPLTAVGIFLRDGYFKQYFDDQYQQHDEYPSIDATLHPFEAVVDESGKPVVVTVHVGQEPVHLRAWRIAVGRVDLFLLDADFDFNSYEWRFLTRRLYQGDRKTRIQQEIILGIGGLRLLRAINRPVDVFHMNEGHCAFLALELLRESGAGVDISSVRSRCVFTTHTPVIAGHDRFEPELFSDQMSFFRNQLGVSDRELLALGRVNPHDDGESFTMTVLGLKASRTANGVSRLNGEVARRQWEALFPGTAVDDIPIGHVTNGIHLPTWTANEARPFLYRHFSDWQACRGDSGMWDRIDNVSDEELWTYRNRLRSRLIAYVEDHVARQSVDQKIDLDPDVLTIGFARRFATYKRATLFFHDFERAARILADNKRPVQILFSGKAHPADKPGQELIRTILEYTNDPAFSGRIVYLEDYNMSVGRMLVSGCDVWLNNPRRPYEASGTSGQKTAVHGGLNLSILDGWWPEGYNGENGWAIGADASHEYKDPHIQDPEDAGFLYNTLEQAVIPLFYDRGERGLPTAWLNMMRAAMKTLTYQFSAERMIRDYVTRIYTVPND